MSIIERHNCFILYPSQSTPIFDIFSFSSNSDIYIIALIAVLNIKIRPPAIFWAIPLISVDSVYSKMLSVSIFNRPFLEIFVAIFPFVTYRDIFLRIVLCFVAIWIITSCFHVHPNFIQPLACRILTSATINISVKSGNPCCKFFAAIRAAADNLLISFLFTDSLNNHNTFTIYCPCYCCHFLLNQSRSLYSILPSPNLGFFVLSL